MPQNRKAYIRFAVGLYVKEKKIQQQELAKEKASLSTEAKTLQQKIERLDNKVNLFKFTMMWNLVIRLRFASV